ncbi:uncharacterized protein LOC121705142 isoform X2 [Alosa sapidissima]|uniref:uncharacterized protein LOC121705142 isoform X2 n=1 Tax=Alosa sapidissima TaxID=34773 RepID=UPI001C088BBA|nr:uncharacterized protein LOC121705142 isoform X2 [Alosa sapidissima]
MSILCAVDNALKQCEVEEGRSNDNIFLCRDLLTHMKIRHAYSREDTVAKDDSIDISPEVTEELEQLEKLLEKARRTLATHADPRASTAKGKGRTPSLVNSHRKQSENITKVSFDKRPPQVAKTSSHTKATQRIPGAHGQTTQGGLLRGPGQTETLKSGEAPPLNSKQTKVSVDKICTQDLVTNGKLKTQRKTLSSGDDLCRTKTLGPPDANVKAILEEMWIPSPLLQSWTAMRSKQSRLWDKVLARGTQVVPEKTHFMEKLQNTVSFDEFPMEMLSDAPADASSRMGCLTELGRALHFCHHAERSINQSSTEDTGRQHKSEAMLNGLEEMMMGVLAHTGQMISVLDKYHRQEPEVLCPVRRRGAWGDPQRPCLPPTVCYDHQAELQEVAHLRLRVQLLQQETKLQQILRDRLHCGLPSFSAVDLRGQYSLLGEGGLYFPTLVMDTEPD